MRGLKRSLGFVCGLLGAGITMGAWAVNPPVLQGALLNPYPVPSIAGIHDWVHAAPLSLGQYHGKVVLLHFWTYSSINSLRALPQIAAWQHQYHSRGLEVISIHTPEFGFEKDPQNVTRAISKHNLTWPVALDNDYRTWKNFRNNYWPGLYLINPNGYVVYQHFGEGDYSVTENNIRSLLGLQGKVASKPEPAFNPDETPETYMGYDRAERFVGKIALKADKKAAYAVTSDQLEKDQWGLEGQWIAHHDRVVAVSKGAKFRINFNAKQVYAVLGHRGKEPAKVRVWLDGHLLKLDKQKGIVDKNTLVAKSIRREMWVGAPDLYQTITLSGRGQGVLEIEALTPGVELYTVTFG